MGLAFLIPLIYGWVNKSWFTAIIAGISLCLLSYFLAPIYQRVIDIQSISSDPLNPSYTVAEANIWITSIAALTLPASGFLIGRKLKTLRSD